MYDLYRQQVQTRQQLVCQNEHRTSTTGGLTAAVQKVGSLTAESLQCHQMPAAHIQCNDVFNSHNSVLLLLFKINKQSAGS